MNRKTAWAFLAAAGLAIAAVAEDLKFDFNDDDALKDWTILGGIELDGSQARSGKALRIGPAGVALRKLRDDDGAGEVRLWVFDDGTKPDNPKASRATAHWGVMAADGRVLAVGPFCAAYLSGDTTYSTGEYSADKGEQPYHKVSYLGVTREARWREWIFRFDPDKGLDILVDSRSVNAQRQRFDWNQSQVGGFAGIFIVGDRQEGTAQTLWVDDVSVSLGGPMNVKPIPPSPPPPVVPDRDEALSGAPARLLPAVVGTHPRLLFGPGDLPELRRRYQHASMAPFREALERYLPASRTVPERPGFLTDATDGQRQGLWRMPSVAYHYLMTGDEASAAASVGYLKFLLGLENWETGPERDSGMSSANVMIGAALVFDWIHDKLEPEFREQFRRKLILMARRQYYGGHLNRGGGPGYWQGDPQNNHRWHRNAGMTLAAIAAWAGPEDDWILTRAIEDVKFVVDWLPADGTSHESPTYLIFGGSHLLLAVEAADRCLGTRLLDAPFFETVGGFYAQSVTPGLNKLFYFGDAAGAPGRGYVHFLYRAAARHRQADLQALLDAVAIPDTEINFAWAALLWRDPSLTGGRVENLPRRSFFPDLGLVHVREGWERRHAGLMFKCGPLGGYRLNAYRNSNDFKYVNVAHDDPDANSFILYKDGGLLAETSRYSMQKQSANHNTILVNGRGQSAPGRPDVDGWTQPGTGKSDMTQGVRLTAFVARDGIVIAEGEAGGAYQPQAARGERSASPGLNRFRRAVVWLEGHYILILDDVRPRAPADISWLIQAKQLDAGSAAGAWRLAHDGGAADLRLVADQPVESEIVDSPADDHQRPLGWRQLRVHARKTDGVRYAAVLAPWGGAVDVTLASQQPDSWTVRVKTATGTDEFTWSAVSTPDTPYRMAGRLSDGRALAVTEEDRAPIE